MPRSHLPEDFSVDKLPPPTAFDPTDAVSQSVSSCARSITRSARERERGEESSKSSGN